MQKFVLKPTPAAGRSASVGWSCKRSQTLGVGLTIAALTMIHPPLPLLDITPPAQASTLKDLSGYWGQVYVDSLADRGYIGGFPDNTFRPNDYITRAQFAAIAAKALGLPAAASSRIFVDVSSNFWGAAAIAAVSNAGLVGGFPDGTFRPNDRITRAQALVILTKALKTSNPDPAGLNRYGDLAAVPDWAKDSIARAANAGIMVNFPNATLIEPNRVSTRGEVAALMYQTLYQLGIGNLPSIAIGLNGSPPPAGQPPANSAPLSLQDVTVNASGTVLKAGDELTLRATGTPQAQGSFTLEGIAQDLPLTEREAGVYTGSYTVRRTDNQANARISVKLSRSNTQPVVKEWGQRLTIDAQGPAIEQLQPANLALVPSRQPDISATLSDGTGSGINPAAVRLLVEGQDVTSKATITPNFIAYRPAQPFGSDRVNVDLQASDQVGNTNRVTWTFGFGNGTSPTGQPTTLLFPQLTNVTNNATINLPLDIVGRTAPNAKVQVQVDAFTSLAGIVGVSQPILSGAVQADANGQFSFRLQPGFLTPSGTRYRIQLVGIDAQGQRSPQSEVYLVQQ